MSSEECVNDKRASGSADTMVRALEMYLPKKLVKIVLRPTSFIHQGKPSRVWCSTSSAAHYHRGHL
ncbi:hypothetical protein PPTG_22869 [Phytophthora nicotianae INRA-310]|uniref:Uncharacterized protein n=3 Tax=Phytophthora nicotianae TaxID=4792 RepID=W2QAQ3_PHYN3|nr:hypothetical protein PPTG_22869 [Phytophthora nicotianae INRA-310]ETN09330.1 hypothetical protein PPTG_22869 [Phytophthora nicotianae INRA-310]